MEIIFCVYCCCVHVDPTQLLRALAALQLLLIPSAVGEWKRGGRAERSEAGERERERDELRWMWKKTI